VASLRLVSPGAVTVGVILYFFVKNDDLLVTVTVVTSPRVSAFQLIVRFCSKLILCQFIRNFLRLSSGRYPLDGVTRGGQLPFPQ